ncbi:MAG TPA: PKD domain-containing protein [Ktedonobacterales bacterium]|jgi:PKD repeat protein
MGSLYSTPPSGPPGQGWPPNAPLTAPARSAPRTGLRLFAAALVAIALAGVAATTVPGAQATSRRIAFPKPSVSISRGSAGTVREGDQVPFTANVQAGNELSFSWDFGDGTYGTGASTSHMYGQYGDYTVELEASDPVGQTASDQMDVHVLPPPPVAAFSATQDNNDPFTFNFDASASTGAQLQYAWSYGDGVTDQGPTTSHQYGSLGTYNVTLTVTDVANQTDSISHKVTVSIPAPTASFTATQDQYTCTTFDFDASASSGYNLSYSWDFGDGNTDSYGGAQTSNDYYYDGSGTYTVQLTVTDQLGRTSTTSQSVYVNTGC